MSEKKVGKRLLTWGPGPRDDTVAIAAQRAGGKSGSHANRQTGY